MVICSVERQVDVAVVGGGPTGLATALALRRVLPADTSIQVLEARHLAAERGTLIAIEVNGFRALEAIHPRLAHRMYEQAVYSRGSQWYDEVTGERLPLESKHDAAQILTSTFHFGTKLADVQELSPEEQAAAGGFRYALSLERTAEAGAGATAGAGAAGGERLEVRARWLVGADGFFSRVRRQVCWWGSVEQADLRAAGADWPKALRDADRDMTVSYVPQAFGKGTCLSFAARALGAGGSEGREAGFWYLRAPVERLQEAGLDFPSPSPAPGEPSPALARGLAVFAHLPADVRAFIAASKPERVTERGMHIHDTYSHVPGSWQNGRGMVLVGDAAHAWRPDGQGTNLAFEDAAVLGACVREHGLSDEAFRQFEARRVERVASILADCFPPFKVRTALVHATSFDPLWSPTDLPVPVASTEEGLAWSYETIRGIVQRRSGLELGPEAPAEELEARWRQGGAGGEQPLVAGKRVEESFSVEV
ncbi:hypothetical protein HYH03_010971 [Edaphochlamys debaryana]|uniref:FAD-binding domain-containing protein n=1 Tax=Edaphochlamys debaryana TaxID=47281 RepID=A0A835XSV3_9CHLO|nr:hypothetical protein HYH03_010971 [Edaphochlamys debaryana]|eukprot:KAG2490577.1 hypothetical protein HYH03_010971 [Edaphochlamys debaryana]